jgi:hypothetical protein
MKYYIMFLIWFILAGFAHYYEEDIYFIGFLIIANTWIIAKNIVDDLKERK